ncbi:DNA topoisomerase IV subunit A [Turicibacter sanguinis]|jgi:DNA topoisomerase IV, A subunit|uniref:DNA topoisomerase 4 subunit A n=3 Tax=Turicibacter sanguinis TaxID=154288 RepID=A0A9X4XF31_9FIRM|nr:MULTISPECIES: DNA topoisomerase IV subunit A [Turicibacter]EFF63095.1 DNA topoisomerase IV, A subunit [Turicibacter sanguinis PC909]EGC91715.1 DNA topoisomerase IV, A subunit [Turicibacter sp. HGF1]MBP3904173.1 DNA topoisomerase IV subunit A [Turicibacter sp.]MCU7190996.1 DNA topoisomerase IV subunit A [Turicibacter sanguinis]MCU7197095.1 DNA topoisomerase IV subunit A [Turicibacter sanguinis]
MENSTQRVQVMRLEDIMGDRFGRYSKYIIQDRALPDARDGLKPVQRRILYAMYKDGNTFEKAFRKSAKTVGNVIGNYHPHGDSSVYEAMVRMSQDWKLREPLVQMHGNNGSIDGDPAAAMRYTEARLSAISGLLLKDIDKNLVDFIPNFDDSMTEPTVLPAFFPNLLVNGATGISAGYATDIPPHNLAEIIDAVIHRMNHKQCQLDDLLTFIKGPDFPTGAIIQGIQEIKKAYATGKGRIIVRSKAEIETIRGGRDQIVVTEIPYEVNKANLVKKIDDLRIDKKIDGIMEVRDETDRNGLRIVIELKKDVKSEMVLNYLFKNTDLQVSYNINMVAIHNKRPVLMGLMDLIDAYIQHQKEVVTNRSNYDLKRARERQHIVEGLIKMVSVLDEVVHMIRQSKDKSDAKKNLMVAFEFSERQAEAIVMLQLYRLTNTDVTALQQENEELSKTILELTEILSSETKLLKVIQTELKQVRKDFKTERRSQIEEQIQEIKIDETDMITKEDVIVAVTKDGYVKRTSIRSYNATKSEMPVMKDGDELVSKLQVDTLQTLLMFTNRGSFIYLPVYKLPEFKWKDIGQHVSNLVTIDSEEKVIAVFAISDFKSEECLFFTTANGMIKKTRLGDFEVSRYNRAMMAMAVKEDDVLISVVKAPSPNDVIMVTKQGYLLKFSDEEIAITGLKAMGVKGIAIGKDDQLIKVVLANANDELLLLTQRGNIKKLKVKDIALSSRNKKGSLGIKAIKSNPHYFVDCIKVESNQEVYIKTETTQVKLNLSLFKAVDLNSVGTNIVDDAVMKLMIDEIE